MALNKALEDMEVKRFQLSAPYLFRGYYPCYSLTVASALLVVSSALAVGTGAQSGPAGCSDRTPLLLFRSFTGFCAVSVLLLMASTLAYRLCGGSYALSSQTVGRQVDWAYEVILKENAQRLVPWLATCSRAERVCVVAAIALMGEAGKFLPFWSFIACGAAGWIVFLVLRAFLCRS